MIITGTAHNNISIATTSAANAIGSRLTLLSIWIVQISRYGFRLLLQLRRLQLPPTRRSHRRPNRGRRRRRHRSARSIGGGTRSIRSSSSTTTIDAVVIPRLARRLIRIVRHPPAAGVRVGPDGRWLWLWLRLWLWPASSSTAAASAAADAPARDEVAHLLPRHAQLAAHLAPRGVAAVVVRALAAVPLEAAHSGLALILYLGS